MWICLPDFLDEIWLYDRQKITFRGIESALIERICLVKAVRYYGWLTGLLILRIIASIGGVLA